ncbi:alanine--tRNA ligase-related protein [Halomarina litorea]|uniref:alanine--tRNA ligase-related protein n=1 Tax=Halomarina litorea TaxID=2961595 RepID=UPI0020C283AB|nr:DHHA1 domain-containing protein [Halomarina sp. BCD28]
MPSRAAVEPERTDFDATVETREGREVVLDTTYFYPEGGGQPADRGVLGGVPVVDVQYRDDRVVHTLAPDADASEVDPGSTVACAVDQRFRTYCMRAHTASHVLYGAGRRLLDDLGYGGFGIGADPVPGDGGPASVRGKVRVDFTTPTDIDDDTLIELERLVNRAVWESRPVSWETYPKAEALELDGIAFNTKTEEGLGAETVRVVTVGAAAGADADADPWDVAACGGTHVSNTREIGPVTVLERSNPGEGLTRVEFAVGEAGIDRRGEEKGVALAAARDLGTNLADVPDAVARLRDERDEYASELADLRGRLVDARIAELREETVTRDGATWLVGRVEGLDANALADRARELAGDGAGVVALVDDGALAVATDGETDAGDVVEAVTDEFGGGGGGSPTVAQGGGLGASDDEVVAFLRGE